MSKFFKSPIIILLLILLIFTIISISIVVSLTTKKLNFNSNKIRMAEEIKMEALPSKEKNIGRGKFISFQDNVLLLDVAGHKLEFVIDKSIDYFSCMPEQYIIDSNEPSKKINLFEAFIDINRINLDVTETIFDDEIMISPDNIKDKVLDKSYVIFIPKSASRNGELGLKQKFIFLNCNF